MHRQDAEVFRIGRAAATIGVSVDTLRRWDDQGRATFIRRGGKRWMTAAEVKRLRDARVAHTPVPPQAVNRFDAVVGAVHAREASVDLELEVGPHRLEATISRAAADELGARRGRVVRLRINPADVAIERLDRDDRRDESTVDG